MSKEELLARQILAWIRTAEKITADLPDGYKGKPLEGLMQDIEQACQETVKGEQEVNWQEYARELYETLDNVLVLFIAGNGRDFDYSCVQKALELFKRGHKWWPLTLAFAQMIEEKDDTTGNT